MSRNRVQDAKMEGELLALTYGAIVARVMKDTEQCEEANAQVKCAKVKCAPNFGHHCFESESKFGSISTTRWRLFYNCQKQK